MSSALRVSAAALLALLSAPAIFGSDRAITDFDERFRIKYGRYPAHVEERRNKTTDRFSRLDQNGDGRISRQEWKRHQSCLCEFSDRDRDGDGHITRSEWHAADEERSGS